MLAYPRSLSGLRAAAIAAISVAVLSAAPSCGSSTSSNGGSTNWGTHGGSGGFGVTDVCGAENEQTSCIRDVPESISPSIECTPKVAGTAGYDGCTPNTPCGPLNGCPLERCDPLAGTVDGTYAPGPADFTPPSTDLPAAGTEMQGWMTGWFARDDGTLDRGSCALSAVRNLTGVALSSKNFGHADWCGACAEIVSRSGKRVRVQIVDQCTGCKELSLDVPSGPDTPGSMLEDANFQGAYLCSGYDGSIPIAWHIVPCEAEGGVRIQYIEGFNAFTPAIRLSNYRLNIVQLEEQSGGEWKTLPRMDDNKYFLTPRPNDNPIPIVLRMTAIDGSTINVTFPAFEPGKFYETKAQF